MSKEPGPREKALREMREAKEETRQRINKAVDLIELKARVAIAATKTGKSRKPKK